MSHRSPRGGCGRDRAARAERDARRRVLDRQTPELERHLVTGDFNADSRLDLIATSVSGSLLVALGGGGGTFNVPQPLGIAAEALAAADFNDDGRLDLLARDRRRVLVLPGAGTGTFGPARVVHTAPNDDPLLTAAVGSFSAADDVLDIAVSSTTAAGESLLLVYAGNRDLTFAPPLEQVLPSRPAILRAVHLDDDGITDLVGAATCCASVVMLRSAGTMAFTIREFLLHRDAGDVRAADLNGDRKVDVVVTLSHPELFGFASQDDLAILWDGFDAVDKEVLDAGVPGEFALALGDFTGDGRPDIATGNWSIFRDDNLGLQMWSSVSVLKGSAPDAATGAVSFGSPVSFALGNVNTEGYTASWNLEAADVNGDGRLDLVHAPGAILLNKAPGANRAPAVFAGPDRTLYREMNWVVKSEASDPDGHWLTYRWSNGRTTPWFLLGNLAGVEPGVYTLSVTVDDGQGATASDSVTLTVPETTFPVAALNAPGYVPVGSPYTIEWTATDMAGGLRGFHVSYSTDAGRTLNAITECINLPSIARSCTWMNPGPASDRALLRLEAMYGASDTWVDVSPEFRLIAGSAPLPPGWQSRDIGSVAAPGHAATSSGVFLDVSGSGADIWGTADEFHYAYTSVTGDFEVVTLVQGVENVSPWTKAGLMVRNSTSPGAAHVSLFATPSVVKGLSLQARRQDGGNSIERRRVSIAPTVPMKLTRRGNAVTAAYWDYRQFTWVDLPAVEAALTPTVLVGVAVSSHVDGTIASARFSHTVITQDAALPPGIAGGDVGAVGAAGTAAFAAGTYTIEGSGADIWGTTDEFHFVYTRASGDFDFTARVASIEAVNRWTKVGLMVRDTLSPGSRHASVFATPTVEKGVAFQARRTTGSSSTHLAGAAIAPPVWLRLARLGQAVTAFYRKNETDAWTPLGSVTLTGLPASVLVGMAVSSHVDGTLATAGFERVVLTAADTYNSADIGAVGRPGTTTVDAGQITLEGSGTDIWGTADAFRFFYRQWYGDGSITARVSDVEHTHAWAKAGVMFRETLAPNAKHIMAIVSPGKGVAVQYRGTPGGTSANAALAAGTAPEWLRLSRAGSTFTALVSENGTTWRTLGSWLLPMTSAVYVGLPVTSHDNATLATAAFDSLDVAP